MEAGEQANLGVSLRLEEAKVNGAPTLPLFLHDSDHFLLALEVEIPTSGTFFHCVEHETTNGSS